MASGQTARQTDDNPKSVKWLRHWQPLRKVSLSPRFCLLLIVLFFWEVPPSRSWEERTVWLEEEVLLGKAGVEVWVSGQTARTLCSQVNWLILWTRPSPLPSSCCSCGFLTIAGSVFRPSSCFVAVGKGNTLHMKTHPVGRSKLDTPALPRHVQRYKYAGTLERSGAALVCIPEDWALSSVCLSVSLSLTALLPGASSTRSLFTD